MSWTTSGCADDGQVEKTFLATVINQNCNSIPNNRRGQHKRATAYSEAVTYLLSRSKTMAGCLDVRSRNAINLIFRSLRAPFHRTKSIYIANGHSWNTSRLEANYSRFYMEWAPDSSRKPLWPAGDNQTFRTGCETHSKVMCIG